MSNKASEIIAQLQELVAEHGDLDVWVSIDDEGNGYNSLWGPQVGYVRKEEADDYRLDSITTHMDDLIDEWREHEVDEEVIEEGQEWCDIVPDKEQLDAYLAKHYVKVIVH